VTDGHTDAQAMAKTREAFCYRAQKKGRQRKLKIINANKLSSTKSFTNFRTKITRCSIKLQF